MAADPFDSIPEGFTLDAPAPQTPSRAHTALPEGFTLDEPTAPPKPFNVLPFSEDAQGKVSFDSNAGLLGALKRSITAPLDAYQGKFDPMSPEGNQRAFETAFTMSPASAAMQAGERIVPGVLKSFSRGQAPTASELQAAKTAQYDAARATGAEYPGAAVDAAANEAFQSLHGDGILAELAPKTFAILDKLRNPPEGSSISIENLDAARKALGKVFGDRTDMEAARRVVNRLDDFIQSGGQASPLAGATPAGGAGAANGAGLAGSDAADWAKTEAARLIKDARGNAAALFRSDRITGAEDAAELRAAAANSGQNIGNATRQRLASLLLNDKQSRGFSAEELAAIRDVVEGTASSNTLRYVGNLLGGGGGIGQTGVAALGAAAGSVFGGGAGAAIGATAAPLVGAGTRAGYNGLVGRQVSKLDELIRQRSPLYQEQPLVPISPEKRAILMRLGLLSGEQANEPVPLDLFSHP